MVVLKSFYLFIAIAFLSLLLLVVVSLSGFWQVQGSSVFSVLPGLFHPVSFVFVFSF